VIPRLALLIFTAMVGFAAPAVAQLNLPPGTPKPGIPGYEAETEANRRRVEGERQQQIQQQRIQQQQQQQWQQQRAQQDQFRQQQLQSDQQRQFQIQRDIQQRQQWQAEQQQRQQWGQQREWERQREWDRQRQWQGGPPVIIDRRPPPVIIEREPIYGGRPVRGPVCRVVPIERRDGSIVPVRQCQVCGPVWARDAYGDRVRINQCRWVIRR